jgi:hypothetical protein
LITTFITSGRSALSSFLLTSGKLMKCSGWDSKPVLSVPWKQIKFFLYRYKILKKNQSVTSALFWVELRTIDPSVAGEYFMLAVLGACK